MNEMSFLGSLTKVSVFLKEIDMLRMSGPKKTWKEGVSDEFKKSSLKNDYLSTYKIALKNYDFDFLLKDQSFLQFSYRRNTAGYPDIRYAFYQNPQDFFSYEDYLKYLRDQGVIDDGIELTSVGDIFYEEYQQFLTEQHLNTANTSIRYDVDQLNYRPLIHSLAHIHFGQNNNIRIPCDKILTPLKFVMFVLNHAYYYVWESLVKSDHEAFKTIINSEKRRCRVITADNWQETEKVNLFIT